MQLKISSLEPFYLATFVITNRPVKLDDHLQVLDAHIPSYNSACVMLPEADRAYSKS
jgi:hypothetical protein